MRARSNATLEGIYVNVKVNGRAWTRVGSFKNSNPEDSHYVAKTKESGETIIVFGDGKKGKQPPTGSEITASYRDRLGVSGNRSRKRLEICFCWDRRCTRVKGS